MSGDSLKETIEKSTSAIPPRDQCVFPAMLDTQAARYGSKPLIVFEQDEQWSYAQAASIAREAAALQRLGVQRGEPV